MAEDLVLDNVIQIDIYMCHCRVKEDSCDGGGLLVYVKNDVQCTRSH